MVTHRLGIIMHGVTGRMGMNQHLIRSIVAIRNQGGVTLSNGDKVMPCLLYTSPSPRDRQKSRMPSSA